MDLQKISKIEKSIENLKNKQSKVYFLVQDTRGNAKASISYIYNLAYTLFKDGYNVIILHEKPDYVGVSGWLDPEFMTIPHKAIEGQNLEVSPEDFLVIPELYGFVMSQVSKLPCGKIVLCQAYDHILETLQPGQTWTQLGFFKCVTTSEQQKEFIENLMRGVSIDILEPFISDDFKKQKIASKPIIAIHTREPRDTANIIKSFYVKFPQYRWVTFRDMRGLTQKEFANVLRDCFVSVWVDETSGYGTFPLESMKTGVPVIGLTPNMLPYWLNTENGVWVNNKVQIVDFVANFLQNWLEDNINEKLYSEMINTVQSLPTKETFEETTIKLFSGYINTRLTSFEEQLEKLQVTENN